ncbi:uncharacterized protein LOC110753430 isoform X3 [Prunus avium]|uniref:Uncharacterized protein LOC110753430 isoform X1 n=1 Tax=Prunus avium TaxID=42229 RepID=A0A6P5S951_PRUAV|nr:uncharacterized protein LOC110753430 isoform X1 [Prunus avium]XP_021810031.1 uncharacterized protein LOC110753430 isoform X2 [Prunus avium]XP_021810032.1 uncharacterized protein LOC110753430 isoform X3 [Prunus avium]
MEDDNYIDHLHYQDKSEEEEDAEEALSLCDLPLDNTHDQVHEFHDMSSKHLQARRSSSDQLFEFFSDISSDSFMCSAEDIIVCGKLIPFKQHMTEVPKAPRNTNDSHKNKQPSFRRRSESLSELQSSVTRSSSSKNQIMMRNSRSLDYRKLHRQSSMVSPTPGEMERNSSVRSVGKSDKVKSGNNKPKWFFLMFGIVKFPAEMDLNDIKNRQIRRNPSTTMFPRQAAAGKGSWRLLKALSCKDHASVAVTTPFCTQV